MDEDRAKPSSEVILLVHLMFIILIFTCLILAIADRMEPKPVQAEKVEHE